MSEQAKRGLCLHCGAAWDAAHAQGKCGVAAATLRILEGYQPRTMTTGFDCPNGHGDGVWKWGPESRSFECAECKVLVDPYTGERINGRSGFYRVKAPERTKGAASPSRRRHTNPLTTSKTTLRP